MEPVDAERMMLSLTFLTFILDEISTEYRTWNFAKSWI
jgi:hypothetical protein